MTDVRAEAVDGVAVLTVSNPAARNAMNGELSGLLVEAVDAAVADPGVHALVVTGDPPAFCAGGDLDELRHADEAGLRRIYAGFLAVIRRPLPTVAAVNGPAVGAGLNLALACDVRLAGPTARFDPRFLALNMHPGGGFTWMLHRALGPHGAAALTLFGEALDAADAQRLGLVWRTYPDDAALLDGARTLAARAAAVPRELACAVKATLATVPSMPHGEAVDAEVAAQVASMGRPAFQERIAELRAHRRP